MLKLLATAAFIGPVFFMGQFEDVSDVSYLDQKVQAMSECTSSDVYIYFHDQYVEMHSMEHLHEAIAASTNCKIENITVSYLEDGSDNSTNKSIMNSRSEELSLIFAAYLEQQNLNFKKTTIAESSYFDEKSVAKISFKFNDTSNQTS